MKRKLKLQLTKFKQGASAVATSRLSDWLGGRINTPPNRDCFLYDKDKIDKMINSLQKNIDKFEFRFDWSNIDTYITPDGITHVVPLSLIYWEKPFRLIVKEDSISTLPEPKPSSF
jgi:hypothetical protein